MIQEWLELNRDDETLVMAVYAGQDQFLDMLNLLKQRGYSYQVISKSYYQRLRRAGVPGYLVNKDKQYA